DADLYQRCLDDLARLGFPGLRADTLDYFTSTVEEGYPIYHLDYLADRERLLGFAGGARNLISCGRQGAFRYIFMDTAMEMGLRAAAAVLGEGAGERISELGAGGGLIEAQALTA